jgi:hypothetical protein
VPTPEEEAAFAAQFAAEPPAEETPPAPDVTQEEADALIDAVGEGDAAIAALKEIVDSAKGLPELPPEVAETNRQASHAFAEQRRIISTLTQEKDRLTDTIQDLSAIFGVDEKLPPEKKAEELRSAIVQYRSQKDGIPVEVLQQMQSMETRIRSFADKELSLYNQEQWLLLKEKYHVDDMELETFKEELLADPAVPNWTANKIDWAMAYRDKHFEDHGDKVAALVAAELERRHKAAATKAPTPPVGAGTQTPPVEQPEGPSIANMKDLNKVLRSME